MSFILTALGDCFSGHWNWITSSAERRKQAHCCAAKVCVCCRGWGSTHKGRLECPSWLLLKKGKTHPGVIICSYTYFIRSILSLQADKSYLSIKAASPRYDENIHIARHLPSHLHSQFPCRFKCCILLSLPSYNLSLIILDWWADALGCSKAKRRKDLLPSLKTTSHTVCTYLITWTTNAHLSPALSIAPPLKVNKLPRH